MASSFPDAGKKKKSSHYAVTINQIILTDFFSFLFINIIFLDFHGIDLCPMFPNSIKPSNARFIQHNMLETLPFADNSLDYIHMRVMLCNLTQAQLIRLLAETNRILKPLGFVEIVDVEYRIQRPGPIADQLLNQKCKFWSQLMFIINPLGFV